MIKRNKTKHATELGSLVYEIYPMLGVKMDDRLIWTS